MKFVKGARKLLPRRVPDVGVSNNPCVSII